jgi:hypothetical protein
MEGEQDRRRERVPRSIGSKMGFSSRLSPFAVALFIVGVSCGAAPPAKTPLSSAPTIKARGPALAPTEIDRSLRAAWTTAGVEPAPRADDATFLRRAYVDLVGTVPLPDDTAKFLADRSPDKRAKLVDQLLESPAYADHWMNYWDDVLMGRETRGNTVDRGAFRAWLRTRFAANAHWDVIATELITGTGQNSLGGARVRGPAMQIPMGAMPDVGGETAPAGTVNGAVNWPLRYEQTPQDFGASASRIFLGVQIQCAQCHDHKTESWKQEDFRRFSSAFLHTKVRPLEEREKGAIRRVELEDQARAPARFAKNADLAPLIHARATALDGTDVERGAGSRKAIAAWMTAKKNPWFAKAFVNRMWGHLLGRGFFDPVDDLRPSNPGAMPELLDRIAADFSDHDFDVKHLLRTLCATEAYQLAASSSARTDPDNRLWGKFHLVPLGPEELMNAIMRVTDLETTARADGLKDLDALRREIVKQYAFLFDTDEEADEPDYSGTVSQALALLNGALVARGSRLLPGSAIDGLTRGARSTADAIDALTVRVLARHPTPEEQERWASYVDTVTARGGERRPDSRLAKPAAPPAKGPLERLGRRRPAASARQSAYEDILWSMLNSSEFTFNH